MQDYRDYKTIFNLTFNHNNKFLNLVSNTYINGRTDTSWPPQKSLFYLLAPFFQYNTRLLRRQKMGGACLYMPQDGHWLASFEVIPPPKKKKS